MNIRSDINTVADYFLSKSSMTHKKLQKLVYYAYSWYIVINNDNSNVQNVLFSDAPEAWIHGPVFPILYDKYKIYVREEIPKTNETIELDLETNELLNEILNVFRKYDGDKLELMTHQETPWKKARENLDSTMPSNNIILSEDIYNYYSNI